MTGTTGTSGTTVNKTHNSRNDFVVDVPDNDPDILDLLALKRVKEAISKKKKDIKEKDWSAKHPDLHDMVQAYRKRTMKVADKDENGVMKVKIIEEPVNVDLGPEPRLIKTRDLERSVATEMATKAFNDKLEMPAEPPVYKVDSMGRFF